MMPFQHRLGAEIMENLPEDKKKILMKRMIDGKIMKRENRIKLIQFKIETLKMARKMIDES